jgi:hypothetical protein
VRRYEREHVVIGAIFIRRRGVPSDHVNWMRRKTKGQPFVQGGDNARVHAALKLLRGI